MLILLTEYETLTTGNVIIRPKQATFKSLKEFVNNGFKIVDIYGPNNENLKFAYEPMFNMSGILDKINDTILYKIWNGTLKYKVLQCLKYIGEKQGLGIMIVNRPEFYL